MVAPRSTTTTCYKLLRPVLLALTMLLLIAVLLTRLRDGTTGGTKGMTINPPGDQPSGTGSSFNNATTTEEDETTMPRNETMEGTKQMTSATTNSPSEEQHLETVGSFKVGEDTRNETVAETNGMTAFTNPPADHQSAATSSFNSMEEEEEGETPALPRNETMEETNGMTAPTGPPEDSQIGTNSSLDAAEDTTVQTEALLVNVWMAEGPAKYAQLWQKRFGGDPTVKLYYHSFDEPCDGCIFVPNTGVVEGRNLVLSRALQDNNPHVKYYVAFDPDLLMECTGEEDPQELDQDYCWQQFHKRLLQPNYQYPMASPKTWWEPSDEESTFQSCVDGALRAYKGTNALKVIYPMLNSAAVQRNVWLGDHLGFELTDQCLPLGVYVDADFTITNPEHGTYPNEQVLSIGQYLREMERAYPKIWGPELSSQVERREPLRHRCRMEHAPMWDPTTNVSTSLPQIAPSCQGPLNERFQAWVDSGYEYIDGTP